MGISEPVPTLVRFNAVDIVDLLVKLIRFPDPVEITARKGSRTARQDLVVLLTLRKTVSYRIKQNPASQKMTGAERRNHREIHQYVFAAAMFRLRIRVTFLVRVADDSGAARVLAEGLVVDPKSVDERDENVGRRLREGVGATRLLSRAPAMRAATVRSDSES